MHSARDFSSGVNGQLRFYLPHLVYRYGKSKYSIAVERIKAGLEPNGSVILRSVARNVNWARTAGHIDLRQIKPQRQLGDCFSEESMTEAFYLKAIRARLKCDN